MAGLRIELVALQASTGQHDFKDVDLPTTVWSAVQLTNTCVLRLDRLMSDVTKDSSETREILDYLLLQLHPEPTEEVASDLVEEKKIFTPPKRNAIDFVKTFAGSGAPEGAHHHSHETGNYPSVNYP